MSRINLFEFTRSISNESVSHPDVKDVKVNGAVELPKNVADDTDQVSVDKDIDAEVSNTKTSEPGPKDGGGDGTAHTVEVKQASVGIDVADVNKNLERDQQGGHHVDALPKKVNAKDNLSASDVSTSVEDHDGSEESELKSIDASGAEEIQAADDMVMDLDGEELEVTGLTDVSDKGKSEADSLFAKTKDLEKAAASIERYSNLLSQLDAGGKTLSRELRQAISWGLEDIDAQLFFHERASLESFDPTARVSLEAQDLAVTDSLNAGEDPGEVNKGLSSKLKKVIDAGIRMFWRAINAVVDYYNHLTGDMPKIRTHLAQLKKDASRLQGGTSFKLKGGQRLLVGDEFVGDSRQAIDQVSKVATELLLNWPNQLGKVVQSWGAGRASPVRETEQRNNHINEAKLQDDLVAAKERAFRGLTALSANDRDRTPSGFLNVDKLSWSGPLPGNRALYVGVADKNTDNFKDSVVVSFSAIPNMDTHTSEVDVDSLSSGEANLVIRELEKLTHFVDDVKQGTTNIKKVYEKLFGSDGERFLSTAAGAPQREDMYRGGELALSAARATFEANNQFLGYVTAMIKAYIGYITLSLKAEGDGRQDSDIEGQTA